MSIQIVRQALASVLGQNSKTLAPVVLYTQRNRVELSWDTRGSSPKLFSIGEIEFPKVANQSGIAQIFADFFASKNIDTQILINLGATLEVFYEKANNPNYKCGWAYVYATVDVLAILAKQAEEVAQIQEEAELEAAILENESPTRTEPIDVNEHTVFSGPAVCAIPKAEPIAQVVEFTKHDGRKSCLVVKTLTNSETGETFPFSEDFDSDFFCSPTNGTYVWGLYSVAIAYTTSGQLIFKRDKTPTSSAKRETYYFDDETLAEQFKDLYIDSLDDFCYRAGIDPTEYANIILGAKETGEEPTTTAPEPTLPPAKKDPHLAEFEDSVESETNPEDLENSEHIITWGDYSATLGTPLKFKVVVNGAIKSIDVSVAANRELEKLLEYFGYVNTKHIYNSLKAYHEKHYTPQGLQMYDCENTDSMFFSKLETAQKQVFAFNANGIALTGVFKYDADIRTYTVVGWDNTRKEPVIMKDPQRFLILETTTAGQYSCSFLSGQNHRSLPVVASQPTVRNAELQTARLSEAINI